jgi:hypothetical protein
MQAASLLSSKLRNPSPPQTYSAPGKASRAALLTEDQYLNASLALMAGLKLRMALGTSNTHAFESRGRR